MQKLMALNRGEIAIRILRAADELGFKSVAICSQEDRLLVMGATSMQTTLYAPTDGRVARLCTHPGQRVEAKDLLLVIE